MAWKPPGPAAAPAVKNPNSPAPGQLARQPYDEGQIGAKTLHEVSQEIDADETRYTSPDLTPGENRGLARHGRPTKARGGMDSGHPR
jgi:hypothetical protein